VSCWFLEQLWVTGCWLLLIPSKHIVKVLNMDHWRSSILVSAVLSSLVAGWISISSLHWSCSRVSDLWLTRELPSWVSCLKPCAAKLTYSAKTDWTFCPQWDRNGVVPHVVGVPQLTRLMLCICSCLIGPIPSITRCRRRRCHWRRWRRGHRCAGSVRQYTGDTW